VLTRKSSETIWIGKDIEITVVRIGADRVRLGIEAPAEMKISRDEPWEDSPSKVVGRSEDADTPL